jgi:hypothetical protein
MNLSEFFIKADNDIARLKSEGRNKHYLMSMKIEDINDITTRTLQYYNSKGISVDVHQCIHGWDFIIWW